MNLSEAEKLTKLWARREHQYPWPREIPEEPSKIVNNQICFYCEKPISRYYSFSPKIRFRCYECRLAYLRELRRSRGRSTGRSGRRLSGGSTGYSGDNAALRVSVGVVG